MRVLILLFLIIILASCNHKESTDLLNKNNVNSIGESGTKSSINDTSIINISGNTFSDRIPIEQTNIGDVFLKGNDPGIVLL